MTRAPLLRLFPVLLLAHLCGCAGGPDTAESSGSAGQPSATGVLPAAEVGPSAQSAGAAETAVAPDPTAAAQESAEGVAPSGPRLLEIADYQRFETVRGAQLSPDGRWLAYPLRRADDSYELRLRALDEAATEELVVPWARGAVFSADGRRVAWRVDPTADEAKRLRKAGEPVRNDCEVMLLAERSRRRYAEIDDFGFDAEGTRLALLGHAEGDAAGAALQILDLDAGHRLTLGNVGSFAWCDSAPLLAIAMRTGAASGNGVQLYDARSGLLRDLDASRAEYRGLAWRKDADDLAVLRSVVAAEEAAEQTVDEPEDAGAAKGDRELAWVAVAWRGLADGVGGADEAAVLDPAAAGLDAGLRVAERGGPRWSEDGTRIAVGICEAQPKADVEAEDDADSTPRDLPGLQVWHSNDVRIFPRQRLMAEQDASRTQTAVWDLDAGTLTPIDSDRLEGGRLLHGWEFALEQDTDPYPWGEMFGRPYHDLWLTTVATGERRLLLEKVRYTWPSAGGGYVLSFDGEHYWTDDLQSGARTCITAGLEARFADQEYDTPTDLIPPYGVGDWLQEDAAVLLYDRFDVWQVAPDGSGGRRLTRGAEEQRIHRLQSVRDDDDAPGLDPGEPLYFRTRGEWTERQGYARLAPGATAAQQLIELDKQLSGLQRAEDAEVYLYSAEARDDSPDLFVAGPELSDARAVTATNAFLDEFLWTHAELLDFTSDAGVPLQACLLYPADHDPAQPAPMIVYTYEQLSQDLHRWQAPSDTNYYNFTVWTQHGYFVLLPDIVYRAREPGPSALDAVRPAVAAAVATGLVDEAKVGLIGHSWGGYQAAYLPTRTDIFAASVAGAPLTDFVSFMGQIHWAGGVPETSHWETGQGRMEVPYWEDPEAHRRSSPLEGIPYLQTPMLMTFGDDDGSVDWDQGTQFYNYARRAGKQMVLLVYEGEGHGLRKDANRRDYHRRILEWFGHYLKGEEAPAWITEGVPYEDLEAEKSRLADPLED